MSQTPEKTKARFAPYRQRSPSPSPSPFPKTPRKEDGFANSLPLSDKSPAHYARFKSLPPESPALRTIVEETTRAAQSSELPLGIEDAICMSELEKLNIHKVRSENQLSKVAEANKRMAKRKGAEAAREKHEEDKKTRTPHKRDRERKTPGKCATTKLASATRRTSGASCAPDLQPSLFPRPPSSHFPSQRPPFSPAQHAMAILRAEEEARRARRRSKQKAKQAREQAQREEQRVLAEQLNATREAQAAEEVARQDKARALEAEAAAAKAREAAREEQTRLEAEDAAERAREEVRQEQARALAERQAAEIRALQAERARVAQAQAMEEERIRLQREAERLAVERKALEQAQRQAARLLAEAEQYCRRRQAEMDRIFQQQEETLNERMALWEKTRR